MEHGASKPRASRAMPSRIAAILYYHCDIIHIHFIAYLLVSLPLAQYTCSSRTDKRSSYRLVHVYYVEQQTYLLAAISLLRTVSLWRLLVCIR